MSSFPLVSIIIPTYNCSEALRLTLESVLLQDLNNFEVWVVGDGCTDNTEDVVASLDDPRINWVNLSHNSGGPSVPRNEGLRRACSRWIAYLGHDDLWLPWHLSSTISTAEKLQADFAASLGVLLGPSGTLGSFCLPDKDARQQAISPSSWIHRRDLIDRIGPWCEALCYSDDREFLDRIYRFGVKYVRCRPLSVLKYPAGLWKIYNRKIDLPQARDLESIRLDARALQRDLLFDLAILLSKRDIQRRPAGLVKTLIRLLMDFYGNDRWPLPLLYYHYYRTCAGLPRRRY